ncbi:fatty acid desaturase family protein [Ramlibacter sp.]|uniref:fatty acid desaturase family protein n=1 Tax=Ramlibacter sp. TaxID=1917967 RepID=UPI003D1396FF
MDTAIPPPAPHRELQLRAARAAFVKELGADRLAMLHRGNLFLDLLAIVGAPALFLANAWVLATHGIGDPLWWLCLVLQGDLVLVMAFINHDAFVHRKLFPPRLRWVLSSILVWPSQMRGAAYEQMHLTHHRALGTEGDTEFYKMGIDTPLKRILYATPALMVYRVLVLGNKTSSVNLSAKAPEAGSREASRLRWEKWTRVAVLAAVIGVALWDWRYVVFGYVLPFATVTPLLNTIRIVLEHLDLDRDNPLWVGTFYRTGPFSRLMFWWDAGDCHLVHHFYANIPYYRMNHALRLMRPILIREGVYEQRSLFSLLGQWFSGRRAHWSAPRRAPTA